MLVIATPTVTETRCPGCGHMQKERAQIGEKVEWYVNPKRFTALLLLNCTQLQLPHGLPLVSVPYLIPDASSGT